MDRETCCVCAGDAAAAGKQAGLEAVGAGTSDRACRPGTGQAGSSGARGWGVERGDGVGEGGVGKEGVGVGMVGDARGVL